MAPFISTQLPSSPLGLDAALAPDALPLGDGRLIPFSRYATLEAMILEAILSDDPDRIAAGLPRLIATLGRRPFDPASGLDRLRHTTALELAEALVLDAAGVIERLYQQRRRLEAPMQCLAPTDRRRVYGDFVQGVLASWRAGAAVQLPPLELPSLWRAYLRNRIFGLGLLKAPSLFAGAVDVALRYLIARAGMRHPLPVPLEGSPGAAGNRRLVAVEHSLREERMAEVMTAEAESLRGWLEELLEE
jgi:hypothetical protein